MEATEPEAARRAESVDLTIIIISHNTRDLLRECLGILWSGGHRSSFRVMVVDNASRDRSGEVVRREFPRTELVENQVNVGYSRAVNQALRVAAGRYCLILNPDVRAEPGSIDALVRFMDENPRVGVAGGRLLNPDGSLQYSCRSFYTFRTLLYRRTFLGRLFPRSRVIRDHLMSDWDHESVRAVDWVLGACMMVRREAVGDVGLMDERFFLYFEDVDWCYRMKRRGWEVCYVPQAVMIHHHRRQSAQGFTDPRFLAHLNSVFHFYDKWNRALFVLKRYRHHVRLLLFLSSDVVAINGAFLLAYLIRHLLRIWLVKPVFPLSTYYLFLAFVNVTTVLSLFAFGLYQHRPGEGQGEETVRVGRAVFAGFLILMAATFLAQTKLYSRAMIYLFWPLAIVLVGGGRLLLYRLHEKLRELRFDLRRVLLVGAGDEARRAEQELYRHPELGYEVVGAVAPGEGPPAEGPRPASLRDSWRLTDLPRIIEEEQVEEVLVAGEGLAPRQVPEIVRECRARGVPVTVLSEAAELVALGGRLVGLGPAEALGFAGAPWGPLTAATKRALDLAGAAVGLLLLPLVLLGGILRGRRGRPLLTRRRVVGKEGKRLELLELADFPSHSFWRALPQVWNVLRGEMSLVGPRPRDPLSESLPPSWGPLASRMRPGMTGPWRLPRREREGRDRTPAEWAELVQEMDRRYLRNWSLSLDLRILVGTGLRLGPERGRREEGEAGEEGSPAEQAAEGPEDR